VTDLGLIRVFDHEGSLWPEDCSEQKTAFAQDDIMDLVLRPLGKGKVIPLLALQALRVPGG